MNRGFGVIAGIFLLIALLAGTGMLYVVNETEQVVVTQFGELIGRPISEAGLYFKWPWQTANYFEKRVLEWDGDPNEIPTRDKRNIYVDTAARWRIKDALKFMRSVGSEAGAQTLLDDIIDAKTREVISGHFLIEAVRNSNRLLEEEELKEKDVRSEIGKIALEPVSKGREALSREILERAEDVVLGYGLELVDVRFKRINYVERVRDKVYERMISERKRAAEQFRAEGQGQKAEIEGQRSKELEQIQSEAYKRAQEIQGEADAKAIKIFADAYNKDPEFYTFLKSLESYQKAVNKDSVLILSTDNEFYRYLKSIQPGE